MIWDDLRMEATSLLDAWDTRYVSRTLPPLFSPLQPTLPRAPRRNFALRQRMR